MEEFLKPIHLSQNQIANYLGAPPRRIHEIVSGQRRITANIALRLAHYFNMSLSFWMGLQMDFDLDLEEDRLLCKIPEEVQRYNSAHKRN